MTNTTNTELDTAGLRAKAEALCRDDFNTFPIEKRDFLALLDRLERTEADREEASNDSAMWERACDEADRKLAAAGAVPEGFALVSREVLDSTLDALRKAQMFKVSTALTNAIAAAPPAQGLPKKPDFSKFATLEEYKAAMREYEAITPPAAAPSEPVAYADPQAFRNFKAGSAINEWMWAFPNDGLVPMYLAPPPAQDAGTAELLAALVEAEAALAGGLWDYGPGQDEHERCNEVIERCRRAIANSGRTAE